LQKVLGAGTLIQLNVLQTILQVFVVVIVPVALGMLLKSKRSKFSLRMQKPVKRASGIFFVIVLLAVIIKERVLLLSSLDEAGLVSLSLNVITMAIGYGLGYIFKLSLKQRISITIEGGIQNGTLGISIATILLNNTAYAIAPAVYGIIMFLTAGLFIFWIKRGIKKERGV